MLISQAQAIKADLASVETKVLILLLILFKDWTRVTWCSIINCLLCLELCYNWMGSCKIWFSGFWHINENCKLGIVNNNVTRHFIYFVLFRCVFYSWSYKIPQCVVYSVLSKWVFYYRMQRFLTKPSNLCCTFQLCCLHLFAGWTQCESPERTDRWTKPLGAGQRDFQESNVHNCWRRPFNVSIHGICRWEKEIKKTVFLALFWTVFMVNWIVALSHVLCILLDQLALLANIKIVRTSLFMHICVCVWNVIATFIVSFSFARVGLFCVHCCNIVLVRSGYFDQHMRQNLFTEWCHNMHQVHIQFKPDIARIEVSSLARYFYGVSPLAIYLECVTKCSQYWCSR